MRSKLEPIIQSLLDVDFYKFTMGYVVFKNHRNTRVRYGFKCRTKGVRLADHIREDDLRWQLDQARKLRFNLSEIAYLRGLDTYGDRIFSEDYLKFLKELTLPEYELEYQLDGSIKLEFPGLWSEAIYWETIALSIINELYFDSLEEKQSPLLRNVTRATGVMRLADKIKKLQEHPEISVSEFGTRRRRSRGWQEELVRALHAELAPLQFRGTSNTRLAYLLGIEPMGTSAHEMFMVPAAIAAKNGKEALRNSHNQVLREWWEVYGKSLSIALTDTFGTDFFFRDMTKEQALAWKGLRHDSGDPVEFGEKAIRFYESHGIDPREKMIVFSDGLDLDTIIRLHWRFLGKIRTTFGWGTNLTNDLGFAALSLVVKPIWAEGANTVKLSDNLAKATGYPKDIENFKEAFGYTVETTEECRY